MNIGIDIVEVKRIGRMIRAKRFLERVYTDDEIAYCMPKAKRDQHFAVRFAAKEAVWKALGQGSVSLKDIGVKNLPDGKPEVLVRGRRRSDIMISLSHTEQYAAAVAVIK